MTIRSRLSKRRARASTARTDQRQDQTERQHQRGLRNHAAQVLVKRAIAGGSCEITVGVAGQPVQHVAQDPARCAQNARLIHLRQLGAGWQSVLVFNLGQLALDARVFALRQTGRLP